MPSRLDRCARTAYRRTRTHTRPHTHAHACTRTHTGGTYQVSYASSSAYQNLYDNHDGLRDSFAAFWRKVATELLPFPNILAFELLNEPFAGGIYHNPALLFPGVADRVNLQNFYKAIAQEIRKVDQRTILAFEGVTWDNFVYGFTEPPGG